MTDANYKRITCAQCNTEFNAKRKKMYCSLRCSRAAYRLRSGIVPRAEYDAARKVDAHWFKCEHCGKDSHRKLSGTNTSPNRFCSMACRCAKTVASEAIAADARLSYRLKVAPEVAALRRIARYVEKPSTFRSRCIHCDALMIVRRNGGLHQKVCHDCTASMLKVAWAIGKAKRRAVERGAEAHNINPIAVFDRDKWRCRLCGARTPKALRGTYEPRAPELDHILPISKGGSHTWGNVQCACRACNGAKSDKPLGQFSFDAVR